MQKKMLKSYSA